VIEGLKIKVDKAVRTILEEKERKDKEKAKKEKVKKEKEEERKKKKAANKNVVWYKGEPNTEVPVILTGLCFAGLVLAVFGFIKLLQGFKMRLMRTLIRTV
jgi:hypothetical protein